MANKFLDKTGLSTLWTKIKSLLSGKLDKTTYEWNKELACGSNGKVCLGKFGAYDTNITITLTSTTSITYNATIIIQSQNIVANGTGGSCKVDVYGDANNNITPLLSIFRPYGSANRQIEVYANLAGWSKNIIHVQAVALSTGGGTDILTSVNSIPTAIDGKLKVTPTNVLTSTYLPKSGGAMTGNINMPEYKGIVDSSAHSGFIFYGNYPAIANADNPFVLCMTDDTPDGSGAYYYTFPEYEGEVLVKDEDGNVNIYSDENETSYLRLGVNDTGDGGFPYLELNRNPNEYTYYNTGDIVRRVGTEGYRLTFPAKSGTIALLEDLQGGGGGSIEVGTLILDCTDDDVSEIELNIYDFNDFELELVYSPGLSVSFQIIYYGYNSLSGLENFTVTDSDTIRFISNTSYGFCIIHNGKRVKSSTGSLYRIVLKYKDISTLGTSSRLVFKYKGVY